MPLVTVRRARVGDAAVLAELYQRNADWLAPWEPLRPADWATETAQRQHLERAVRTTDDGRGFVGLIEVSGAVVGRVNLNNVVRGVFDSADLGYWVAEDAAGQGVATRAVRHVLTVAFGPLHLHRVQAGTLLDNGASQKVLEHNGFEVIGVARRYLRIAGEWRDHLLFQRLAED